jgi:dihydrofolate synthase / folylpolyglutamate synthase
VTQTQVDHIACTMSYERYLEAEHKINEELIRVGLSIERENTCPRGPEARMEEMRQFLLECGNPQKGIPAVHVTGTSGKGTVASAIAGILTEAGLRVGLHISPYLQSATEKIWVNGRFVSAEDFAILVDWVMPVAAPRVSPETPASIHGMASVAIALEGFRRESVDLMVFEAGCGGRFDLTSFVDTSVAVITNVGLDHVVSLGPDIAQIAWHKAGIARPGAPLITGAEGVALDVIRTECNSIGAPLTVVEHRETRREANRLVATEAAKMTAELMGTKLDEKTIERGLTRVKLAGRTEIMPGDGPRVIIDGAHNAEKLSFAVNAALAHAKTGPRVCVIGVLGTKSNPALFRPLANRFDAVVATEPMVYAKTASPAEQTAEMLKESGYEAIIEKDMFAALDRALKICGSRGTVLVTGSFYLVGELRERWFRKKDIVCECSSWPSVSADQ